MGQNLDIAVDAAKRTASDLTIIPRAAYNAIDQSKDDEIGEQYHTPQIDKDYATREAVDRGDTNTVKSLVGEHPMYSDAATTGLAHKAPKKSAPAPPQPSASVKKLHTGGYVVSKHHGDGKPSTDHGAKNMAEVSGHLEDHMGEPNEGEAD